MDLTGTLRMVLTLNRALQRDMARSPLRGVIYWAEALMEGRLILDATAGKQTNAKRLVHEVAPEWIGASTAHRILQDWRAEQLVEIEPDPVDRRTVLIRPTARMLARASERYSLIDEDGPVLMQRRAG
jgi:hypothetical protein